MQEQLCQCCKTKPAVRCYEGDKKEESAREFYCLECYSQLFLDGRPGEGILTACPRCGTTLEQIRASKIVGCAHCYGAMLNGILPIVQKMQGGRAHSGKTPPLDNDYAPVGSLAEQIGGEYRAQAVAKTRYLRQCAELKIIIRQLKAEGNLQEAKNYEDKLSLLQARGRVEEERTW